MGGQGAELSPVSHYSFVALRPQKNLLLAVRPIGSGLPQALPSPGSSQTYPVGSKLAQYPAPGQEGTQNLHVSPAQVSLHLAGPQISGTHTPSLGAREGLWASVLSTAIKYLLCFPKMKRSQWKICVFLQSVADTGSLPG